MSTKQQEFKHSFSFIGIAYEARTVPVCMKILRSWSQSPELLDCRISAYVPKDVREMVRTQCKLEGLI